MNLSTIARSVWNVSRQPNLLLPHAVYDSFDQLPVPLSKAFPLSEDGKEADIRAVVLDKDNCFARAGANVVHPINEAVFQGMIKHYSARNVLIVSNSSGFAASDPHDIKAQALEKATNVRVLRHTLRKPGCGEAVLSYFKDTIDSPSQIAVVGDRLWTDVLLASNMHSRSIWIRRGVEADSGALTRIEYGLHGLMTRAGMHARPV